MPASLLHEQSGLPYRLGRHINHDPRSRLFGFSARPEADVPIVTTSWQRRIPILDQGSLGSCTGNAAAGWIGTDNTVRAGITDFGGTPVDEADAVAIYSQATRIDPFPGVYPPDDTGSDGLSVAKVLKAWGLADSYSHCFTLDETLRACMSGPVLIGILWYENMCYPDVDGLVTPGGPVVGGHELCLTAVDVDARRVTFANSWGDSWGVVGYGQMTWDTLGRLLSEDGDATVPHPVPVPLPPAPLPDRSWWRRLWDWLLSLFRLG